MSQSRLAYLFSKYINKTYTSEEKLELFEWIEEEENHAELLELLEKMVKETGSEITLTEQKAKSIIKKITDDRRTIPVLLLEKKKKLMTMWVSIAAILVIGLWLSFSFHHLPRYKSSDVALLRVEPASKIQVRTFSGESKNVLLDDGTEIWLSPSSILEYSTNFRGALREVSLSGEAFFEVARDESRPFIIHSGEIETKVLGTSFNIQAYDNQDEIAVTVVTGKVKVFNTAGADNMEVVANQRAVFHKPTTILEKESEDKVKAPDMVKRKEGMFVYRNEKLQKLIDDLQEYFGVAIHTSYEIRECRVMANFYVTDDLKDILEPLAMMVNGSLRGNSEAFFINGKGCPQ